MSIIEARIGGWQPSRRGARTGRPPWRKLSACRVEILLDVCFELCSALLGGGTRLAYLLRTASAGTSAGAAS